MPSSMPRAVLAGARLSVLLVRLGLDSLVINSKPQSRDRRETHLRPGGGSWLSLRDGGQS